MSNFSAGLHSAARRSLPILDWIPRYRREWLLPDIFAGVALWAVMVPEGMAYAGIVGVPPIMGLYTIVPALLAYALLGTSRQLVADTQRGDQTSSGVRSDANRHSVPHGDAIASLSGAWHTSGARRNGHSNDLDRAARRRDDWCARGRPPPIRVAPP